MEPVIFVTFLLKKRYYELGFEFSSGTTVTMLAKLNDPLVSDIEKAAIIIRLLVEFCGHPFLAPIAEKLTLLILPLLVPEKH